METITTVGLDLAKSVFSLYGVNAGGGTVLRKTVWRDKLMELIASLPPCLIGIEACGGAHEWARQFQRHGHRVGISAAGSCSNASLSCRHVRSAWKRAPELSTGRASCVLGGAMINVTTMPNFDDFNGAGGVINRVHDSEFALPNSVPPLDSSKLFGLRWSRLGCQRSDAIHDTLAIFLLP